jgi:uncharacterized membrane protein
MSLTKEIIKEEKIIKKEFKIHENTIIKIALIILSLAGFFISAYLAILHYKDAFPPCSIVTGCETVLTSQFATIFGIPLGVFGGIYFLTLIFSLLAEKENNNFFRYFRLLTLAGLVVAVILFVLQAFVLHAYCQFCLLVEIIILGIFILDYPFSSSGR